MIPRSFYVIDSISSPGGSGGNEDALGWRDNRVWVIDGATPITPNIIDDESDARWLASVVSDHLASHASDFSDMPAGFAGISKYVDTRLRAEGFPEDELPPACSLGVIEIHGSSIHAGIVGDVFIYVPSTRLLIRDERFGHREKKSRDDHGGLGLESASVRSSIAQRRRQYIYGPGDMYVLSRSERVRDGVSVFDLDLSVGDEFYVMSDGFTRLVESYGIFRNYDELVSALRESGGHQVLGLLRDFERCNSNEASKFNFKKADDASMLRCLVR